MASLVYTTFKLKDGYDWAGGGEPVASDYKVMLLTADYTPDADHEHPDEVSDHELTGGSYARQDLPGRNTDILAGKGLHTADNVTFTGLAAASAPKYAVVYRVENDDTDHQLVCCIDLGANSVEGTFTVRWDDAGEEGVIFEAE